MVKLIVTEGVSDCEKPYLQTFWYSYLQIITLYVKYNKLKAWETTGNILWRNTEARSCNNCCSRKTKTNKYYILWVRICNLRYSACNVPALYYSVICNLPGSTTLFHIIS